MLDLKLLSNELSDRKDDIIGFEQEASDLMDSYKEKLPMMDTLDKQRKRPSWKVLGQ